MNTSYTKVQIKYNPHPPFEDCVYHSVYHSIHIGWTTLLSISGSLGAVMVCHNTPHNTNQLVH